jgi:hypothetical protein
VIKLYDPYDRSKHIKSSKVVCGTRHAGASVVISTKNSDKTALAVKVDEDKNAFMHLTFGDTLRRDSVKGVVEPEFSEVVRVANPFHNTDADMAYI